MVAVHEIGHAIGLEHSYDEKSIMYPSYQVISKDKILPQPDRYQIQSLYGAKQSTATATITQYTRRTPTITQYTRRTPTVTQYTRRTPTPTTRGYFTAPNTRSNMRCETYLDAAFNHPDGTFHTIEEGVLWRYLSDEQRWEDRAISFSDTYPDLSSPQRIVAGVYDSGKGQIILFTNENAYSYNNQADYPDITRLPANLRNSIIGAIYYRSEVSIITQTTIRAYQTDNGYQQRRERNLVREFPGLRGPIKAAFTYNGLHHFFTAAGTVYVWSERANTWETKGRPMETSWFACSNPGIDRGNDYELRRPSKQRSSQRSQYNH